MKEPAVRFLPGNKKVHVPPGSTLLEAALKAGLSFNNLCGSGGICGRCKMIVREGKPSGNHQIGLALDQINQGMVLACLASVESDLVVEIPKETIVHAKKAGVKTAQAKKTERLHWEEDFSPLIKIISLKLPPPSLTSSLSDHQRVLAGLVGENVSAVETDWNVLEKLAPVLRENNFSLKAVSGRINDSLTLLDVRNDNEMRGNWIVIIDIGTTTIKAQLVDCAEKSIKILGNQSCFNSQGAFGRDVTARIIYSEKAGPRALQKAVLDDINTLIEGLVANGQGVVRAADIYAVVCAGNTVMTHLLLGLPAFGIRRSPYVPVTLKPPVVRAGNLGININPAGLVYCLPGISGWVGGDISAGILVTGIHKSAELCLLVDLGTNGEIVLGNREWMVATSASAGPALEGANEQCGMQAVPGAIERVYLDKGEIRFRTIGGQAPLGICGSGIIDLLSVMLKTGIINRSGRLIEAGAFADCIREREGIKEFVLYEEEGRMGTISLSEPDIENIITAKAAIFAAIKILVRRFDLDFSKIGHLFLAGAFGNYLNVKSAVDIGLIPFLPESRLHFAGNTSLLGAKMAAVSREAEKTLLAISENTTYFDLMGEEDYVEEFRKALFLPHTDLELFQNPEREKAK